MKTENEKHSPPCAFAKLVGTPEEEYRKAAERGILFPGAGIPDLEAIRDVFGLTPDSLNGDGIGGDSRRFAKKSYCRTTSSREYQFPEE